MSRSVAGGRASSQWGILDSKFQFDVLPRSNYLLVRFSAVVVNAEDFRQSLFSLGFVDGRPAGADPWCWVIIERRINAPMIVRWRRGASSRTAAMRAARARLKVYVEEFGNTLGEGSR